MRRMTATTTWPTTTSSVETDPMTNVPAVPAEAVSEPRGPYRMVRDAGPALAELLAFMSVEDFGRAALAAAAERMETWATDYPGSAGAADYRAAARIARELAAWGQS
jgi:hypothetical protein